MLTGFQLRAAIGSLKIRVSDLSKAIDINRFTIFKLRKTPHADYIQCHTQTLLALESFFTERGIVFLDNLSISLEAEKQSNKTTKRLSVFQLRACRATLDLTLLQLSELSGVSKATIFLFEQGGIFDYIESDTVNTEILRKFFTEQSFSFPDDFTVRINR
jgi:DNA-binding XRE family transcriptional regulator